MSLDWNVSKCDQSKVWKPESVTRGIKDPPSLHSIAYSLIWSSMAVDLGSITTKNIDEWFVRLKMLEAIGLSTREGGKWQRADIERCIGLTTNVCNTTRAAFVKKIGTAVETQAKDELRRASLLKGGN